MIECISICSLSSSSSDRSRDWLSNFCLSERENWFYINIWMYWLRWHNKCTEILKCLFLCFNSMTTVCVGLWYLMLSEVEGGQVQTSSVWCLPVHSHHVSVIIRQSVPDPGRKHRRILWSPLPHTALLSRVICPSVWPPPHHFTVQLLLPETTDEPAC